MFLLSGLSPLFFGGLNIAAFSAPDRTEILLPASSSEDDLEQSTKLVGMMLDFMNNHTNTFAFWFDILKNNILNILCAEIMAQDSKDPGLLHPFSQFLNIGTLLTSYDVYTLYCFAQWLDFGHIYHIHSKRYLISYLLLISSLIFI